MNDDDLRGAFRGMADSVESSVRRPAGRLILQRAGLVERPEKPFPLAGIIGVAALPFVAVGALLVYPATANDTSQPIPTIESGDVGIGGSGVVPSRAPSATPTASSTGSQAVSEQAKVVVVYSDDRIAGQPCRQLTDTNRLVPIDNLVGGAVAALIEGPLEDEVAVGLASPLTGPGTTFDVDQASLSVAVAVPDEALPDDCAVSEFAESLGDTVGAFEGWTVTLTVGGEDVDVPMPADEAVPDSATDEASQAAASADAASADDASPAGDDPVADPSGEPSS